MLRMGKETNKDPQTVLSEAAQFFGPEGVGLSLMQQNDEVVVLEGGGGYVAVNVSKENSHTAIDVQSREFTYDVRKFMEKV